MCCVNGMVVAACSPIPSTVRTCSFYAEGPTSVQGILFETTVYVGWMHCWS